MIWIVVLAEGGMIALCVYQIRQLTARIHFMVDLHSRTIALAEKMNEQLQGLSEHIGMQQIRISNNEHRIRDIYKSINDLKGWPTNEVE